MHNGLHLLKAGYSETAAGCVLCLYVVTLGLMGRPLYKMVKTALFGAEHNEEHTAKHNHQTAASSKQLDDDDDRDIWQSASLTLSCPN